MCGTTYVNAKCGKLKASIGVLVCKSSSSAAQPNVSFQLPSSSVVDADKIPVTVTNNGSSVLRLYGPAVLVDAMNEDDLTDVNKMLYDMYVVDNSGSEPVYTKFSHLDIQPNSSVTVAISADSSKKVSYNALTSMLMLYYRYDTRYYMDYSMLGEHESMDIPPFGAEENFKDVLKK